MQKKRKLPHFICQLMRFTAFQLLLIVMTFVVANAKDSKAQEILNQKISITMEEVKLKKAISYLESSASVYFTYNPQKIKTNQKVSISANNETLKAVLDKLFTPIDIDYKVYNNSHIVLNRREVPLAAPEATITGKVMDEQGDALIGVNVVIKGTGTGTITDFDGNYSIDAPDDATLVFSYTGYSDVEIAVADATGGVLNVTMSQGVDLESVTVLGSRGKPRTNVDRPVPIDVIGAAELQSAAQPDIGQALHFTAPSFNAPKFGINDLAPLIDPASLRGLSPDQTLLLVNGKRRHKVAFFSNNSGVGKGQIANDINSIPAAAVKRVEILRDGAAAQYGSDAIAGVMNLQLNDSRSGGTIRLYAGVASTDPEYDDITNAGPAGESIYGGTVNDGQTFNASANFGLPWGDNGFVNTTIAWSHQEPTDRSGTYAHSTGWYPDEVWQAAGASSDEDLQRIRGIDLDRAVLGTAENTNMGIFINAGNKINENWDFYTFGGVTMKEVIGGVFSRSPARTNRRVLEIFPDGFNPEVPSELTDYQVLAGIKGNLGNDWSLDVSLGNSGNNVDLFARNTVNPSLGILSPTQFFTGSLNVTQTIINADLVKTFGNSTLAIGAEHRGESFQQSQGDIESYRAGPDAATKDVGSSGREGFTARSDGEWRRNNLGIYAEIESDITESLLLAAAVRYEDYSDFGSDFSYKVAGRYKISDAFGLRASINRSFRAPALAQYEYSNFSQISFDNDGNSVVEPILPIRDALVQEAFGIRNLDQETSFDIAAGITAKLSNSFSFTVDAYQIDIDDRIIALGGIDPNDFSQFDGAGYDEITIFTNAYDTRTRGLDIVANYKYFLETQGSLGITLAANFNETTQEGVNLPAALSGLSLSGNDVTYLLEGSPRRKIIATVDFNTGPFSILLRGTNFGEVTEARQRDAEGNRQVLGAKTVFDLSLSAKIARQFTITAGVNNLFDTYPDMLLARQVRSEVIYSRRVNQFGTIGRFLNLAVTYNW